MVALFSHKEKEHAKLWWSKIYPEGLNNYYQMLAKGIEENMKFVEKWCK